MYVVNIIVVRAGTHARRSVNRIGKISALKSGILPALCIAHRKAIFVGEVLVDFGGVGVGALNVGICGRKIGRVVVKRIVVVGGKRGKGFQYACGLVEWTRNLIIRERLPLKSVRVGGLWVVDSDRRISKLCAVGSSRVAWDARV